MPAIDVTELLTDPDLAESFTVIRTGLTVNDVGRSVTAQQVFPGVLGVVQPATGLDLKRLPDGSNLSGAIVIWTKYLLTAGDQSEELDADDVEWNGHRYTVMHIADWSNYGAGFVNAACQLASNKARTDGQ